MVSEQLPFLMVVGVCTFDLFYVRIYSAMLNRILMYCISGCNNFVMDIAV